MDSLLISFCTRLCVETKTPLAMKRLSLLALLAVSTFTYVLASRHSQDASTDVLNAESASRVSFGDASTSSGKKSFSRTTLSMFLKQDHFVMPPPDET